MNNVKKLQEAGILPNPHSLTSDDVKVIEDLTVEEINTWVQIKETLDEHHVRDQAAKFFI